MKILRCCFIVFTLFLIAKLKMVKCCSNATTSDQILSIGKSIESSTSPFHDEDICKTRLDRVEGKAELQSQMIIDLRRDHEELKTMFWSQINVKNQINTINGLMEKDSSSQDSIILESSAAKNRINFKRPARLLPLSLFQKARNISEEEKFNDPPTNCRDINHIGYTLNGFYPVQWMPFGQKTIGKIGMIYCNFKLNSGIVERRVGSLSVKSTPVHFYVQRKSTFSSSNRNIPFDLELLNEGRAMNLSTGVFRAPVDGVYYFSFRGFPQGGDLMSFRPEFAFLRVNGMTKAPQPALSEESLSRSNVP